MSLWNAVRRHHALLPLRSRRSILRAMGIHSFRLARQHKLRRHCQRWTASGGIAENRALDECALLVIVVAPMTHAELPLALVAHACPHDAVVAGIATEVVEKVARGAKHRIIIALRPSGRRFATEVFVLV